MTDHTAANALPPSTHTRHEADVLVLGGGPAATWAAVKAREAGASVILVDKGYCGSSGATAAAGTGVWYVPPVADLRESAMASRESMGGFLADRRWMQRVLDETWARVPELDEHGYPFPVDQESGLPIRTSLQGPDYMKRQRQRVARAGVRILDHSPALELLVDDDGAVVGANGVHRQTGDTYSVRAGATVLATGGCAFLSRTLGCNVDTGESYLFAAEAGAQLSGMEFSNSYSIAPAHTSITKSAFYFWATFYREDGSVLEGAGAQRGRSVIARTLIDEPVYCRIDRIDDELRPMMRSLQPNFFQPFDRVGIDPFTQVFPVTLILEGTVRGTGGVRVIDDGCATSVPGLYAAGDAATREEICGGVHRRGQPQRRLGDQLRRVGRQLRGPARTGAGAGRACPRRSRRRRRGTATDRNNRTSRGVPRRRGDGAGRGHAPRPQLLPNGRPAHCLPRSARPHLASHSRVAESRRSRGLQGPRGGSHDSDGSLDVRERQRPDRVTWDAQAGRLSGPRP